MKDRMLVGKFHNFCIISGYKQLNGKQLTSSFISYSEIITRLITSSCILRRQGCHCMESFFGQLDKLLLGFRSLMVKNPPRRNPAVWSLFKRIPGEAEWLPTPIFLSKSLWWTESLSGCSSGIARVRMYNWATNTSNTTVCSSKFS